MPETPSILFSAGLDTKELLRSFEQIANKFSKKLNLNVDTRQSHLALGQMAHSASEFEKSLEAASARVSAFGAIAGVIYSVKRSMDFLLTSTIQVEKQLKELNVIFNASSENLKKFSDNLFDIGSDTGNTFANVSKAAVEFARQGLGVEETLKRTRDALILTQLSGLDMISSTEAITTALNSFNNEVLTSTKVVNILAAVDAKFAVSSADLAEGIKRVGSSASEAGVSLNQLIALLTVIRQVTGRSGAIGGTALRSIFIELRDPKVLEFLEQFKLRVRDAGGEALGATEILQNLADQYPNLTKGAQNLITQQIGQKYHANELAAIIKDLSKETKIYTGALDEANNATDQANKRSKELATTLSAIGTRAFNNLTKGAAAIGQTYLTPQLKNIGNDFNEKADSISKVFSKNDNTFSEVGKKIGNSIFQGLSDWVFGPGLIFVLSIIAKLAHHFIKFANDSIKSLVGINAENQVGLNIQNLINDKIKQRISLEKEVLGVLMQQNTISGVSGRGIYSNGIPVPNRPFEAQLLNSKSSSSSLNNLGDPLMTGQSLLNPFYQHPTLMRNGAKDSYEKRRITSFNKDLKEAVNEISSGGNTDINDVFRQYRVTNPGSGVYPLTPEKMREMNLLLRKNLEYAHEDLVTRRPVTVQSGSQFGDSFKISAEIQRNKQIAGLIEKSRGAFGTGLFNGGALNELERYDPNIAKGVRSQNINNLSGKAFGASMGLSIASAGARQLFDDNTLNGRRGSAITGILGDTASGAALGSITGGPGGMALGATLSGVLSVYKAMKMWNDVLPDLQKNLEKLRETSAREDEILSQVIDYTEKIKNAEKGSDRQKLIDERSKLLESPFLNKTTRLAAMGILSNSGSIKELENLKDLRGGINRSVEAGGAFKTLAAQAQNAGIFKNTQYSAPGSATSAVSGGFAPNFINKTEINDLGEEFITQFADQFVKFGIKDALKNDIGTEQTIRKNLSNNDPARALGNIQALLRRDGKMSEAEGVGSLGDRFNDKELSAVLNSLFSGEFSSDRIDKYRKFKPLADKTAAANDPFRANFIKDLNDKIKDIKDVALANEYYVKSMGQSGLAENEMKRIGLEGNLDRARLFLPESSLVNIQSQNDKTNLQNTISEKRKQLGLSTASNFSTLGLSELEKIRGNVSGEFSTGAGPQFLMSLNEAEKTLEEVSKKLEKGESVGNVAQIEKTLRGAFADRLKETPANSDFIKQFESFIQTLDKNNYESGLITSEFLQGQSKIEELLEQINKTLDETRGAGLVRNFKAGNFSGQQYQEYLSKQYDDNLKRDGKLSGKDIGDVFQSRFAYNTRDLYADLKSGAMELGDTMKSSFKDAFKSFVDGTNNAKEALRGLGLAILNKILDKSIDISFNSLFGGLQSGVSAAFSKRNSGGMVGYASGGLVSGGSGVRDDVPAMLNGGDYVLRKSAVQKYGVGMLSSINNGRGLASGGTGISLNNQFDYNDPKFPTSGTNNISPNLSNFALSDENSLASQRRMSKEAALYQYIKEKSDYDASVVASKKAFKDGQKQRIIGAYISAGIGLAGAGLSSAFAAPASKSVIGPTGNMITPGKFTNVSVGSSAAVGGGYTVSGPSFNQMAGGNFYGSGFHYATGGRASGHDNIPAMLTGGEYVIKKSVVDQHGSNFFDKLNQGVVPVRRASGGAIGNASIDGSYSGDNSVRDLLSKLVSSSETIKDSLTKSPQNPSGNPSVGQNGQAGITLNIVNNFSMESDGSTKTDTKSDTKSADQENMKKFNDKIQNVIYQVIIKESRDKGLLQQTFERKRT